MNLATVPHMMMTVLLLGGGLGCSAGDSTCGAPPCEPDAALQTLDVVDGFRVELFAAEPLVRDPVAMEADEYGRLYVVEDPGYPENPDDDQGRIRRLEDTNGDGRPDRSTVFADAFRAPRGVMRWKDGLLVTDATDIVYLEDTDGDGRADVRRVVMTGFNYGNPQLGVNTPRYGLDNWIYVAHRQGSRPHFEGEPEPEETAARTNVRFRPDAREWESLAGASQFGHSFDAFGRHLLVLHNNHISQEVIDARYLARNPDLTVAPAATSISDHGAAAEVYPITENERHELFTDAGTFTAACGITCYLGGDFPAEYQGAAFVADPAHNLVHADRLEEHGPALVAKRLHENREFLAATDSWFRPVNFYVGPDGALYVIDYYREVIEQPRFLSEEVREAGILGGTDRGRIYRITRAEAAAPSWLGQLDLGEVPADELVARLEHENAWWRRSAQRLLLDRQDGASTAPLEQLVGAAGRPEARVHALWTLEGLDALSSSHIECALQDESPRVREQAIRLAELHLDAVPELAGPLLKMADDADPRVRFQLLSTLGDLETAEAHRVRQQMLYDHIEDEWMQLAALSAADLPYRSLFEEARARLADRESAGRTTYFRRLGALLGVRQQQDAVRALVQSITGRDDEAAVWWQAASLEGLAEGLQYGAGDGAALHFLREPMARLSLHPSASPLRNAAREVMAVVGPLSGSDGEGVLRRAEEIAARRDEGALLRRDAVRLLQLGDVSRYADLLAGLVDPQEPGEVQAAAARALKSLEGAAIGERLLAAWSWMTPPVREAAMETMLADDARIRLVLDAVEAGELRRSAVSWEDTKRLMLHSDDELRIRAQSLLGNPDEARSDVVERYAATLSMEGDAERGRAVYERSCAACHQVNGADGVDFGPDLAGVRNRDPEDLLVDILRPDASIAAGYEQWRIERQRGSIVQGAIITETPGAVTVRDPSGRETTVPRDDIQHMEATDASVMPTGLEQQISEGEMDDLIAFIRSQ